MILQGKKGFYRAGLFLILVSAGAIANMFPLEFEWGQSFLMGGVFSLLLFMIYPLPLTLVGSVAINLIFWGTGRFFPFASLTLLEICCLWIARKKGFRNLVGMDGLFWLFLGLPLLFGLSRIIYNLSPGLSFAFYSGMAINGISCITLASLLYYGWTLFRGRILKRDRIKTFPIRTILFNTVTMGIIILSFLFYALENDRFTDRYSDGILLAQDEAGERAGISGVLESEFDQFPYPAVYRDSDILRIHYVRTLAILLTVLYAAFLLALFLAHILSEPIIELIGIAEALSREEMESLGRINWPASTIQEIQDLVTFSQKSYGNMIERNVQLTSLNRSLEYSAYYDGLTKLPNRTLILNKLEELINEGETFALVFLDLDGFKMLNDSHGHRTGDTLLVEFAYRLSTLDKNDFAARLGGDEFALIIRGFESRDGLEARLLALTEKLVKPIEVEGELHVLHSSIGVALCPDHGLSLSALLRNADLAMYKVKSEHSYSWMIYNEELDNALTQYEMEKGIYKAFENNQFELFYQPQVDIRSGDIISLEALIRWNHPEKGFISPSLFIPLAERMDIIIPIGYWVIEEAAKKGRELVERGFRGVISVNVSPRQFSETNFFHATKDILEKVGLAPEYFGIEVTETMVMGNVAFTSRIISRFMKYGVRVSIDDFGTGYTSLSLLQDLNVHTLKIDQAFVEKVGQSKKNEIVLNNIINLTRELEMDIVVEGVETEEQNSFFRDRACYTSQGFLHHRPLPSRELDEVLKRSSDYH